MNVERRRDRRRPLPPVPCGSMAPAPESVARETEGERRSRLKFGLRDRLAVIVQDVREAAQDAQGVLDEPRGMRDLIGAQEALERVLKLLEKAR